MNVDGILALTFLAAATVFGLWVYVENGGSRQPVAGECRFCGCTEERACYGGCSWANATRTVCSRCMKVTDWQ